MSGAYVAKPAAEVEVDYPNGWDINWSFPGPLPPGFNWTGYEFENVPEEEQDESGDPIPRIWVGTQDGVTVHTNEHDDGAWSNETGAEFWVCLTAEPRQGSITVPFIVSDNTVGTCDPDSYTFSSGNIANWGNPKKVKLIGRNNEQIDGDVDYGIIVGPSTSAASDYSGLFGNMGNALDITSYEEVNEITVYIRDVATDLEAGDTILITATVYQVDPSVTTLNDIIDQGVAVATGSSSGTDFDITAEDLLATKKYAMVTNITIGGEGGSSTASCGSHMYFKYVNNVTVPAKDILLEDWYANYTHSAEYGDNSNYLWFTLDNTDTTSSKLNKLPEEGVATWDVEAVLTIATSAAESHEEGEVSSSAYALATSYGIVANEEYEKYAEVAASSENNDSEVVDTNTEGEYYSVEGTYTLKNSTIGYDAVYYVDIETYVTGTADPRMEAEPPVLAHSEATAQIDYAINFYQTTDAEGRVLKLTRSGTTSVSDSTDDGSFETDDVYYLEFSIQAGDQPSDDEIIYEES